MDNDQVLKAQLNEDDLGNVAGGSSNGGPTEDCTDYCDNCSGGSKIVTLSVSRQPQMSCQACQKAFPYCPVCGPGTGMRRDGSTRQPTYTCNNNKHHFVCDAIY